MFSQLKRALPVFLTDKRLDELEYAVVDVETTGLDLPPHAHIFEIAAVKVGFRREWNVFVSMVRPEGAIRPEVEKLTGVATAEMQGAPVPETVLPAFLSFIGDTVFTSYPLFFDHRHVNYACKKTLGKRMTGRKLCIRSLFEFLYPDPQPRSLEFALRVHDVGMPVKHRALEDAMATAHLLLKLLGVAGTRGYTHFHELQRDVNEYTLNRGSGSHLIRF